MLKSAKIADLTSREDRAIAKLALLATDDTIDGSCRALVIVKRLNNMKSSLICALDVVEDVYSASIGRTLPQYNPCFCPSCGEAVLGESNALNHCQPF